MGDHVRSPGTECFYFYYYDQFYYFSLLIIINILLLSFLSFLISKKKHDICNVYLKSLPSTFDIQKKMRNIFLKDCLKLDSKHTKCVQTTFIKNVFIFVKHLGTITFGHINHNAPDPVRSRKLR